MYRAHACGSAVVSAVGQGRAWPFARRLARDGLAVAVNGRGGRDPCAEDRRRGRHRRRLCRRCHRRAGRRCARRRDIRQPRPGRGAGAERHRPAARGPAGRRGVESPPGPQLEFFVKSPCAGRAAPAGDAGQANRRIIQIDSEVADRPPPGRSAYATAKSAQIGLTRSWARACSPRHHCQYGRAGFHPRRAARRRDRADQECLPGVRRLPGRTAHAVSFLASPAASASSLTWWARTGLIPTQVPQDRRDRCPALPSAARAKSLMAAQTTMPGAPPRQFSRIRYPYQRTPLTLTGKLFLFRKPPLLEAVIAVRSGQSMALDWTGWIGVWGCREKDHSMHVPDHPRG